METTIRRARPEDAPALSGLCAELGYPVTPDALLANLRHLEASEAHRVLVAEHAGQAAGWIHVREEWSLEGGARAELAGLVVAEAWRGQGLGARLVAGAEAWARARGLAVVRVRSRVQREAAHRFYRRLGYAEAKVQAVLDKPLGPPPAAG